MDKIRIAISGIGGVGGYYGGKLAHYYQQRTVAEVFFIARNENLLAIKQKGLRVETPTESFTAFPALVTDLPQDIGVVDYLFLCTKSYDLETNIAQLQPLIGKDTILIPLLNGGNITEQIQSILPYNEIWQGCVYIGSRLTKPGLITKFTEKDQLYFGSCEGNEQQQHQLLSLLTDADINANNPEDITQRIWEKFLRISTAATITSYYNQSIGKVIENHYDDFLKLGNEFISVAKAKGIDFTENSCVRTIEAQKMMPYESTTSMHTDFIKGKSTELETITGYIVRCAKEFNLQVPTYSLMYKELKENKIKPGYSL